MASAKRTKTKNCVLCQKPHRTNKACCPKCERIRKAKGLTVSEALYFRATGKNPKEATKAEIERVAKYQRKSANYGGIHKSEDKTRYIYVLELEDDCWYIGQTTNVEKRFKEHKGSKRSAKWCKMHKPVRVAEKIKFSGDFSYGEMLEDKITLKYIDKYGANKVRGGHFCVLDNAKNAQLIGEFKCKSR